MLDSLGDRMKRYEDASRIYLPDRMPVIIRLDGKSFHTWTRGLPKPYCASLMNAMDEVAKYLCANVQNCVLAYTQSDEISLLLVNFREPETSSWFDSNMCKMLSISAAMASAKMTELSSTVFGGLRDDLKIALFDSRAFVMPIHDVENYFIWRQKDWNRNSIQMLAQSLYSHRELQGKKSQELHEMCFQKGQNWADLPSHLKDGRVFYKAEVRRHSIKQFLFDPSGESRREETVIRNEWFCPEVTPIFTENRELIRNFMKLQEISE